MNQEERQKWALTLRRRRQAVNLTQDKLAELSDVKKNTIARIERGEHKTPSPLTVKALDRVLKRRGV